MYEELIDALRRLSDWSIMDFEDNLSYANQIVGEAADAIEELKDLVARAIGFWDSLETVNALRSLNSYMPDITDPEWQKAHMEMGFYSPIGEVYKEMGVYDEPPDEE